MSLTISSLTDDAALAFDPLLLPKLGRAMDERRRIAVDEDDELVPAMIPTGSGLLAVARR